MATDGSSKRKSQVDSVQGRAIADGPEQMQRAHLQFEQVRPTWGRLAASVLIVGHLWAVFGRPIEFATQGPTGPSPASSNFYEPIRGYSEFAYLNHGYAFFAPDPGPSHLIRVRLERAGAADSVTEEWVFPDLQRHKPRLLYHRHFMLSEFLHNVYQPRQMPGPIAADVVAIERWNKGRARYVAVLGSITEHLRRKAGTDEVEVERLEHQLVGLPEFLAGQRQLDDPQLYRVLIDEDLESANIPRFGVPPGGRVIFGGQP